MRKTARLDEILLNLGYVDENQIVEAVARQEVQGGRLGMNLVETGAIDEKQLLTALAEQFRLPVLVPEEEAIPPNLVARMPQDLLVRGLAVPLSWNKDQEVLSVAVANPGDVETMRRIKEAFQAKGVRVAVAPEQLLKALGSRLGSNESASGREATGITLPELFAWESTAETEDEPPGKEATTEGRILMVAESAARRNFLPPLFRREGFELLVACEVDEVASALDALDFEAVLVSEGMAQTFSGWQQEGRVPAPGVEVIVFSSLSGALLQNPLPYESTVLSLRNAVHALADVRCAASGVSPRYGLIAAEIQAVAEDLGLSRVVRDGLDIGAHLLLPGTTEPFDAFTSSLELAAHLRFPWKLDALLAACHGLYTGRTKPEEVGPWLEETHLAAQILSLVWFRHNHVPPLSGTEEERSVALRAALRKTTGRLATSELVEGYVRLLADRGGVLADNGSEPLLLVGGERLERALLPAMSRVGREAVVMSDLAEAQRVAENSHPSAIVIDYEDFPHKVDQFTRVTKLGGGSLLFVVTDSDDPSLVLNLLDVGVDDVFVPPHDFGLVAARLNRAIQSRTREPHGEHPSDGEFSATFEVFSFLDLIQMLGHARKTVRIELVREGRSAVVYMQEGRLTHAICGDSVGEEAVYRVIEWEEEGMFTVHEETEFPSPSIEASTEAVLMEGCRLLDEASRPTGR